MAAALRPSSAPAPIARAKHLRSWEKPHDETDPCDPFATAAIFDAAMRELGISNSELARLLPCTESTVRDMRRGERPVSLPRIQRMPRALAVLVLRKCLHLFAEE